MPDLAFTVIAYLLLLPVLILVPMKLSFKYKMMISIWALSLTVLCILANMVIPLYQVMIIFTLLLLLSTYFLETRLRPQFLHSSKTSENDFKTQSNGKIQQVLMEETVHLRTDTASPQKEDEEKDGYIEELPLYKNSLNINEEIIDVNADKEVSGVQSTHAYEWEDLEKQLQEWEPPSKKDSIPEYSTSSRLSTEEEEEYNRLFYETKN